MPELFNPDTGENEKFPYTEKGEQAMLRRKAEIEKSRSKEGMSTYQVGGLVHRRGPKRKVAYARGGGAARKDSTRWYPGS
jgi:hypothetical protein